ncbi:FUSC family protein [Bordetella sp. BOR01]|uniref:FUSC family protein n=1 Tax=Bordetella sp. BOR01 TaxID=2854779 RepID=UPI001C45664B|nr:FUSC family protein [Bordetella sp. BOR01]MBV7481925.1 FUSC family protein [Bordetella sp. BOR01]
MAHKPTPTPAAKPRPRLHASRSSRRTVTRLASARYLLAAGQFRESLAIMPPPSVRSAVVAGLQAALAVLLALASTRLSPWPQLVGFAALGALAALFGRYVTLGLRRRIVLICGCLLTLGVLLPSLASLAGATPPMMIALLALLAGAASLAVSYWNLGGPGAVIFVFAIGAVMAPAESGQAVLLRTLAAGWGAVLAWLVCALTDRLRGGSAPAMAAVLRPSLAMQATAAGRITLGCAAAAFMAYAAGGNYPAWAAIGAAAVMQGGQLHITMNRALQRMAGTVLGACIVWAILIQHPSFWVMVAAIVMFQFITEVIIGFNYALGQITVTPMALLMTQLASPIIYTGMPVERVLDTIVGAALGIVFALVFSSLDDRRLLARRRRKFAAFR